MKTLSNVYALGFIVTLCVIVIDTTAHSAFRNRPRSTRGFKNAALSTARGFGKRDGFLQVPEVPEVPEVPVDLPFDSKKEIKGDATNNIPTFERYSVDLFIEELTKHPRLAKVILKKLLDKNQDDEPSSEEVQRNVLEYL